MENDCLVCKAMGWFFCFFRQQNRLTFLLYFNQVIQDWCKKGDYHDRATNSKNKLEKPVNIYKNGDLLKECSSIQVAGRFLKEYTTDTNFRYSQIEKGYIYGEKWDFNGATYTFTTAEEFRIKRQLEIEEK
ncbi:hypothetical protein AB1K32_18285 [Metabacillus dongyingensis]|uniref:hypothetical protein n=1 Tax=Metabacillus dongyingensis TaxID=2874282 RepID=UPI003B8B16C2